MEVFLGGLEALEPVQALRFSRWAYAAVNTGHVFAIALLVGGAVPLALRLLGLWPNTERAAVVRVLSASAGTGLVLALLTGGLLFATRATEYAVNPAWQIKMLLVLAGAASALLAHKRHGWALDGAPDAAAWAAGTVSLLCWIGALACGRLIAFVQG